MPAHDPQPQPSSDRKFNRSQTTAAIVTITTPTATSQTQSQPQPKLRRESGMYLSRSKRHLIREPTATPHRTPAHINQHHFNHAVCPPPIPTLPNNRAQWSDKLLKAAEKNDVKKLQHVVSEEPTPSTTIITLYQQPPTSTPCPINPPAPTMPPY